MEGSSTITLSYLDLLISSVFVLTAGIVSFRLKLNLERRLLIASIRTVVQLLLIGYILRYVFNIDNPIPLFIVLTVMTSVAAYTAVGRSKYTFVGVTFSTLITLILVGTITTFTMTELILEVEPWFQPRYVIPIAGMIVGNAMTGISLTLDQLLSDFVEKRSLIEMKLNLGATGWEASRDQLGSAIRRGMIPIVNSMMVIGIVMLPGMMTGQILAGEDPLNAVKYQIAIMFLIAGSNALGCMVTALLAFRYVFNNRHQLRLEKIRKSK